MRTIEEEIEYCYYVMDNTKNRGNSYCQVPIFAHLETIKSLKDKGFNCYQVGFDPTEPYVYLVIEL